jgi:hypothetical protein
MIYPEADEAAKGGRGKKSADKQNRLATKQFSEALLSQARAVLAYSRELAEAVMRLR